MSAAAAPAAAAPPRVAEAIEWSQSEDDKDLSLEVVVENVVLPAGAQWRDVTVTLADDDVVVAKWKETKLFQWRFHDSLLEAAWRAEDGKLILELTKKDGEVWPALFKLPVPRNFAGLKTEKQLDAILQTEVEPLPPIKEEIDTSKPASPEGSTDGSPAAAAPAEGSADLDKLLDDALDATVPKPTGTTTDEADHDGVRQELAAFNAEIEAMAAKKKEYEDLLEAEEDDDKKTHYRGRIDIISKMMTLTHQVRSIRSEVPTMANFARTQEADLFKARINSGSADEHETEAFVDDEERALSPHEIFQHGVHFLRENNIQAALHFFRLGAIHHKHNLCVGLLHRIYSELKAPAKAAYFVLQRANLEDLDASSNMVVGELFDRGIRHFPPLLACAIKYFQRAAMDGATSAMINLAQLYTQGACTGGVADDAVKEKNKDTALFQSWLNMAIERGNTDAYFIQATLFVTGEHNTPIDPKKALRFFELAKRSNPSKMRRAVDFERRIQQMVRDLDAKKTASSEMGSPTASTELASRQSSSATVAANTSTSPAAAAKPAAPSGAVAARPTGGRGARPDQQAAQPANRQALKITKGASASAGSVAWRGFYERGAMWLLRLYLLYCLAFPLRVAMLPFFYHGVMTLREALGGSFETSAAGRGGMF